MRKSQINPWNWQDALGFAQCWRVEGANSLLVLSGQAPISPEGRVVQGGFQAQARQVFQNLRTVLEQAGGSLDDVVKLTVYLTDMNRLREYSSIRAEYMPGAPPASTAVGVGRARGRGVRGVRVIPRCAVGDAVMRSGRWASPPPGPVRSRVRRGR
jgi:2-iminobutanoate/2-iminopropanoate deaminase